MNAKFRAYRPRLILSALTLALLALPSLLIAAAPASALPSKAIQHCEQLLLKSGTDPRARKLTVSRYDSAPAYFYNRPHDEYWNAGRKAVGSRPFYTVSFTPKERMLGGITVFFLSTDTYQVLWTYRGK